MDLSSIEIVAVLGIGGEMGPGIAISFAQAGFKVIGVDIDSKALDRAEEKLTSILERMQGMDAISSTDAKRTLSRITRSIGFEDSVLAADFITEVVPEKMEIKQGIFRRCDALCQPDVVIASNTSSMDIDLIASEMKNPERALATHWTIPPHLSPLVEVVRGEKTSSETYDLTVQVLRQAGKLPVPCGNNPGFIHNYIQFSMIKAAMDLVAAGHAAPEDVDAVVKNGFGLRLASVGPIQFMDMCGLDTILNIQNYMYRETNNEVFKPSTLIQEKVEKGELGIKSGKGFFSYKGETTASFWDRVNRNMLCSIRSQERAN